MKKICCAIALGSLCSVSAMSATQDPEKTLTKAAIEDAARDLKGIELTLCDHAGVKADGSSTIIRGDGTVVETWKVFYPLTPEEKVSSRKLRVALSAEEVRKIVRLFADDEVLALPKTRPDLVGVRETRCTVALSVAGVGSFEGEHPNLEWSKLPKTPAAATLIRTFRSSVQELATRLARQSEEVLTSDRLPQLADGFFLELRDTHGLWGGESVRVHSDGRIEGVSISRGAQVRHFKGRVDRSRVAEILKSAATLGTFDVKSSRQNGIPDETRPILLIEANVDGQVHCRSVAMWDGEARETPAFQQVRKDLQAIATEMLKKQ